MRVLATRGANDGPHLAPSPQAHRSVSDLPNGAELQDELDAMVADTKNINWDVPDEVLRLCQGYMARCTEIHLNLIRVEGTNRGLKFIRTQQLAKVMELLEFTYKAASRSVEIRRQDVELTR